MDKNNELLDLEKKKKRRKKVLIMGIIILVVLIIGYQYFNIYKENTTLKLGNYSKSACNTENAKGIVQGILDSHQYSFFFKILIGLGFVYLIFIALAVFIDIIKLFAFIYVSGKKSREGIVNLFRRKNEK